MIGGTVITLFNNVPALLADLPHKTDDLLAETAQQVASDAQANAPVLTGALRGSISAQGGGGNWVVVASERYAAYVEFGTAKHGGPQPYMTPAAESAAASVDIGTLIPGA